MGGCRCGWCVKIAPTYEALAKEYRGAVFCKVMNHECPRTTRRFGVRGFPHFIFFVGGQQKATVSGGGPRAEAELKVAWPSALIRTGSFRHCLMNGCLRDRLRRCSCRGHAMLCVVGQQQEVLHRVASHQRGVGNGRCRHHHRSAQASAAFAPRPTEDDEYILGTVVRAYPRAAPTA